MLDRLLIAAILLAAGHAAWQAFTRWQLRRAESAGRTRDPLLADAPPGVPAIVYFSSPTCAPCHLQQTPTLERLKGELGDALHLVRIDASEQPDAASRWGVLSVPTVFVLRADGSARKVFNGVVSDTVLKQELAGA